MRTLVGFVAGLILGGTVMAGAQFYPGMDPALQQMEMERMRQQQDMMYQQQQRMHQQMQNSPC